VTCAHPTQPVRYMLANPVEWMPRIRDIMSRNWSETGFQFAFNPSIEMYQRAVDAGIMFGMVALDGEQVIGYCTMMVSPTMHNPQVVIAANDALFVVPERRGIVSVRLMQAAEREAKLRGASMVCWHARAGTGMASMLARRGYAETDIVMTKEI
jgi:GNAT superfamily N-acetyltransferase